MQTSRHYILIVGPDGSGKSTFAKEIQKRLVNEGINVCHLHFKPWKTLNESQESVANPHELKSRGFLIDFLAITWRLLQYWTSWLFGPMSKKNNVILQERGWLDQIVDPTRYRISTRFSKLIAFMANFLPKPDLIISCVGSSHVISTRKLELSDQETSRQLSIWRELTSNYSRLEIDTVNNEINDTVEQVMSLLKIYSNSKKEMNRVLFSPKRNDVNYTSGQIEIAWELIHPLTLKRKVAQTASLLLAYIGIKGRYVPISIPINKFLFELNIQADGLAIFRSHGRSRWVCSIDYKLEESIILKIEFGRGESLKREYEILKLVYGKFSMISTPEPILFLSHEGWTCLAMKKISILKNRQLPTPKEVERVLLELRNFHEGVGITHGDFTVWNLLRSSRGLVLLDWEHATDHYQHNFDRLRYEESLRMLM